ncbi:MAG: response regulator [Desulfuromonadales bacterium]|nr:response regulator [Desulfuromonadales bacterium]
MTEEDPNKSRTAEEALRRSEERLRLATEAAGIGIWEWDLVNNRQHWDERCKALFGLPPEAEVSYRIWQDRLHPEDRRQITEKRHQSRSLPEEFRLEYRVVWPDGSIHWLLARGSTRIRNGKPVRVLGIVIDITAMKNVEEELLRAKEAADAASRAKTEFLANMSHEIRTPLTVAMGAVELLMTTELDLQQRRYLEMARSSSEALLQLIEDLLDFSRFDAGQMLVREEPFDLRGCIEDAVQALRPQAEGKGLNLKVGIGPGVPGIARGDAGRLRQVLVNLVGNAVKFTEQGEVTVQVSPHPAGGEREGKGFLLFSVQDTGIGVAPEKADRLFRTFSQVDASLTRRYGGTGLGLALSKRIVEHFGGEIWMQSEPGRGSTFSFTLALVPPEVAPPAIRDVRILLAEDDPMVRDLLRMALESRGWSVVTAGSGSQALDAWESGHFDLLLMDVQMPEMDGLEATRVLRQRESASEAHLPIIALTAHARQEDREACRQAGMDDYLAKPIQLQTLFATIERHLAGGEK